MGALFTGMKFEGALGTLTNRVTDGLQQRSTLRAARNGPRTGHLNGARPECFFLDRPLCRFSPFGFLPRILVPALSVFPV